MFSLYGLQFGNSVIPDYAVMLPKAILHSDLMYYTYNHILFCAAGLDPVTYLVMIFSLMLGLRNDNYLMFTIFLSTFF